MCENIKVADLMDRALADARPTPNVDILRFLKKIGLAKIHGYSFCKVLSGGGTNITALYSKDLEYSVAKFFFIGPTGAGDAQCDRELKMLSMAHFQEITQKIKVAPRVLQEFSSRDNMFVGFLMEYIEGVTLDEIMKTIPPGDFDASITTFVRVGWARHNALRASILHKDLHPGNIIFELNNKDWENWINLTKENDSPRVRILDFGSAVMPLQFSYDESFDESWYRDLIRYFNGAFTCVAPEFFTNEFLTSIQGSQGFDCWALGHILYKLYTGKALEIADSVGAYCNLIYKNNLEAEIRSQVLPNVQDHRMQFLITSMLNPDYKKRINLFSAVAYANCLRNKDPDVMHLKDSALWEFVYIKGCNPEYGLPPHMRSNSGY